MLIRANRFKQVWFNFARVSEIGQAFSDEIFRVFRIENPSTELHYLNANPDVERMILRALKSDT
ncbi:MAG: STAS-like domain-containing protein [candidate division Zixibacteria bacterium]|nr:STAS-like domain-containing protein [candidate division Zixibacteria bacterium]